MLNYDCTDDNKFYAFFIMLSKQQHLNK